MLNQGIFLELSYIYRIDSRFQKSFFSDKRSFFCRHHQLLRHPFIGRLEDPSLAPILLRRLNEIGSKLGFTIKNAEGL